MASGEFAYNEGFTLLSSWAAHYGDPYWVWPGSPGGYPFYIYTDGTVGHTFRIPAMPAAMPDNEGLSKLTFIAPNTNDGNGISITPYIESPYLGTLADGGTNGQSCVWTPAQAISKPDINAALVQVRLQCFHGGVPNTFGRSGYGWRLLWESSPMPGGLGMMI